MTSSPMFTSCRVFETPEAPFDPEPSPSPIPEPAAFRVDQVHPWAEILHVICLGRF